jgi:hypothetical protein
MAADQHITIAELAQNMVASTRDKIGAAIVAGALMLHLWRPALKEISEISSELAPFFGCVWIVVQTYAKILQIRREKSGEDG